MLKQHFGAKQAFQGMCVKGGGGEGGVVLGFTTRQPLRVILCRLPEKGRKEIEERVEEMKERDREERGTGMKVKKQMK